MEIGLVLAAAFGGLAIWLGVRLWREARARVQTRASFFSAVRPLFSDPVQAVADTGFGRLSGRAGGQVWDLQAVPDTLTMRKLPALWLLVTLPQPLPLAATVNVMIRPSGVEPFSNFAALPHQIAPPPGFPADCAIRTDAPDRLPPLALLRSHLHLFDDPRVKELILSPKGLRLTLLAEEADRGRYLIFRDAELGRAPLDPQVLRPLMAALDALRADVLTFEQRTAA